MILPGTLIDGLDSGVIVLDGAARVVVWNAWIAGRSEVTAEAALGRRLDDVFPQLAGSHLLAAVARALDNGLPTVMSHNLHPRVLPLFVRQGAGAEPVEQSVVVRPVRAEDGGVACLIQVSDISAAVRRDRHLRDVTVYNRTLFEMAVDPMATVSAAGRLIDVNPAFAAAAGVPRRNLAGSRFDALFPEPQAAAALVVAALADGRANDVLLGLRHAGGTVRQLSFSAATVPSQGDADDVVFLVAHDLTERIEAERDLEEFAYVVSHDLRQPLRTVNSFLTLIERRLGDDIDDELKEFIALAVGGARRMDRLIVDLLAYSRIGRQGAPVEMVPLAEILAEACDNLAGAIADAGARLDLPATLPVVHGCRGDLVRLFQNLLANAIKYVPAGRTPDIAVACRDDGVTWLLSVRDNGIGIAADNLERVFGLFQRLEGADDTEGSGIGLAVCRKIAERHRARLWVESEPGRGSTFCLAWPKDA